MNLHQLQDRITELEQREKSLNLQLEELTDFVENASIPLHWVNGSGVIIWANNAELELLGYAKEEYVGEHIAKFHVDKEVIEDILTRLMRKETIKNFAANLKCKNGSIKPVLINSNVRWKDDIFLHTRCFTKDVSDLKKLDEKKTDLINELQEEIRSLKAVLKNTKKVM